MFSQSLANMIGANCRGNWCKSINVFVSFSFLFSLVTPVPKAHANGLLGLPQPGTMVDLSPAYAPVLIKGLKVHPENPLLFDFIIDPGDQQTKDKRPEAIDQKIKTEAEKLIKYFLASLTIKEDDLWVNLSPYEKNRLIPEALGQTELGRDMLAQDYMLKQVTASLIYPEKGLGKDFWERVYRRAYELYGTTAQVPVNTFNKVWITAEKANVYVHDNTAFVVGAHLKVMLEEDYLALQKTEDGKQKSEKQKSLTSDLRPLTSTLSSKIIREIILPEIEQEVNGGKNFAPLRQIFYSMILATWYKKNLKEAFLNQVYADKAKINGVESQDKTIKEKIYQQYLQAYKKGVFNYIKEDMDTIKHQPVPRKYFSGGLADMSMATIVGLNDADLNRLRQEGETGFVVAHTAMDAAMVPKKDKAMAAPGGEYEQYQAFKRRELRRELRKKIITNIAAGIVLSILGIGLASGYWHRRDIDQPIAPFQFPFDIDNGKPVRDPILLKPLQKKKFGNDERIFLSQVRSTVDAAMGSNAAFKQDKAMADTSFEQEKRKAEEITQTTINAFLETHGIQGYKIVQVNIGNERASEIDESQDLKRITLNIRFNYFAASTLPSMIGATFYLSFKGILSWGQRLDLEEDLRQAFRQNHVNLKNFTHLHSWSQRWSQEDRQRLKRFLEIPVALIILFMLDKGGYSSDLSPEQIFLKAVYNFLPTEYVLSWKNKTPPWHEFVDRSTKDKAMTGEDQHMEYLKESIRRGNFTLNEYEDTLINYHLGHITAYRFVPADLDGFLDGELPKIFHGITGQELTLNNVRWIMKHDKDSKLFELRYPDGKKQMVLVVSSIDGNGGGAWRSKRFWTKVGEKMFGPSAEVESEVTEIMTKRLKDFLYSNAVGLAIGLVIVLAIEGFHWFKSVDNSVNYSYTIYTASPGESVAHVAAVTNIKPDYLPDFLKANDLRWGQEFQDRRELRIPGMKALFLRNLYLSNKGTPEQVKRFLEEFLYGNTDGNNFEIHLLSEYPDFGYQVEVTAYVPEDRYKELKERILPQYQKKLFGPHGRKTTIYQLGSDHAMSTEKWKKLSKDILIAPAALLFGVFIGLSIGHIMITLPSPQMKSNATGIIFNPYDFHSIVPEKIEQILKPLLQGPKSGSKVNNDRSMAATAINGGIDLNGRNMRMDEAGQKMDIHFDQAMLAQFRRGDFTGVRPVILKMTVIPSVLPLLGLAPRKEEEQLAVNG